MSQQRTWRVGRSCREDGTESRAASARGKGIGTRYIRVAAEGGRALSVAGSSGRRQAALKLGRSQDALVKGCEWGSHYEQPGRQEPRRSR